MRKTILSMALMVLIGDPERVRAERILDRSKELGQAVGPGAGRPSPAACRRRAEREKPDRSERSPEQGKRIARSQDQEYLPRLLGRPSREAARHALMLGVIAEFDLKRTPRLIGSVGAQVRRCEGREPCVGLRNYSNFSWRPYFWGF